MKILILLCALSATCFAERESIIEILKTEQVDQYLQQYQNLADDIKANVNDMVNVAESFKPDLLHILKRWIQGTSKHAYKIIEIKSRKINESLEHAKAEGHYTSVCVKTATNEINHLNMNFPDALYRCLNDTMKDAHDKFDELFRYLDAFRQVLTHLTVTKEHCYSHDIPRAEKCLSAGLHRYKSNYYEAKANVTQILKNINNDSDRIRKGGRICISTVLENTKGTMKRIYADAELCPLLND